MIFRAQGRNHFVPPPVGFPLSAPVLSCCSLHREEPRGKSLSVNAHHAPIHHPPEVLSSSCSTRMPNPQSQSLSQSCGSTYIADFPFLPDSYGPEAANLGDLMQLWVRPGVWVHLSFSFSRTGRSAPDTSDDKVICPPLHPISKQSDFREKGG